MPGGSERCLAALKGFVARQIPVLVWAFRARGALFDSKSLRPIAQPGLLREPWAYKGRLPSHGPRGAHRGAPRSSLLKSPGARIICTAPRPASQHSVPVWLRGCTAAKSDESGAVFDAYRGIWELERALGTTHSRRRGTLGRANRAPQYQRPQPRVLGACEQPKKAPPSCRQPAARRSKNSRAYAALEAKQDERRWR